MAEPRLDDFDYPLPPEQIAQEPAPERDAARLLVLERASGARRHTEVRALPSLLAPGDLVVRNTTRVLPARLRGVKATGGRVGALLLGPAGVPGHWRALVRGGARLRTGHKLRFAGAAGSCDAEVAEARGDGEWVLAFPAGVDPYGLGEMPLPPYIRREAPRDADRARYQTVFAREPGAVAAPTAGLHLSEALLAALTRRGVACADVVLHVGPGTFRPLRDRDLRQDHLHAEAYALPEATAAAVDAARRRGGRVVAVGTTSARVLETCAAPGGRVTPGAGETDLFLRPGSAFRVVDALFTNFHLPRSSLLLLVAAFAGREAVLEAYAEAVRCGYRFYSYGDAMLIV